MKLEAEDRGPVSARPDSTRHKVDPLRPGSPLRGVGWLRGRSPGTRRIPVVLAVVLTVFVTVAVGAVGFHQLHLPRLGWPESVYNALRLYAGELGPADTSEAKPNLLIWLALVLAALLLVRGVIALGRRQLERFAIRRGLREHVIVCGAGVHGTKLTQDLAEDHDVVLIDVDAHAPGMESSRGKHEWRLVGDGVHAPMLQSAGVARAHWVVAMTGDDFVNSQMASAVHELAEGGDLRNGVQVLVEVVDPALARFLEEGEDQQGSGAADSRVSARERLDPACVPIVTPFSPNAIAAEALLQGSEVKLPNGERAKLLEMRAPNLLVAGDHPLLDALVLAALRLWRVKVLQDFETSAREGRPQDARPPIHVSVFGPGATERAEQLRGQFRPEPHVLRLEAEDSGPPDQVTADREEWLGKADRAHHIIVACIEELDGVGLTLQLSRAFGDRLLMTRISTVLPSVLDDRLHRRTAASDQLATIEVKSIADLAANMNKMSHLTIEQRLTDAAHEQSSKRDVQPEKIGRPERRTTAGDGRQMVSEEPAALPANDPADRLYARHGELGIRSDRNWRITESERPILEAVLKAQVPREERDHAVRLSTLARAGLRIEPTMASDFAKAAEILSSRDRDAAFAAWCEYARRLPDETVPSDLDGSVDLDGDDDGDLVARLRMATLGHPETLQGLEPDGSALRGASRVAIFAGGAGRMSPATAEQLQVLIERALIGYDGLVLSGGTGVGIPGAVGEAASKQHVRAIGYVPSGRGDPAVYPVLRETPNREEFSIREPLAMWTDILLAGIPVEKVRLVAVPGHGITRGEILLARALGARVAWMDPEDTARPIEDLLPFDAEGVLEIPLDAMTIRAFLTSTLRRTVEETPFWSSSQLPRDSLTVQIAEFAHNEYRRKQQGRKKRGDPALEPWPDLLPALKASNLAQADDIPNKLAIVGRRLAQGGDPLQLEEEEIKLLAEVEHGRWNIERLSAGWRLGEREVTRSLSPQLKPWDELDDKTKSYDAEAVNAIGPALAFAGWGTERAGSGSPNRPRIIAR